MNKIRSEVWDELIELILSLKNNKTILHNFHVSSDNDEKRIECC